MLRACILSPHAVTERDILFNATGCMGMSTAYKDTKNPLSEEESIATIHKALELGVTFLDTSDTYGPFTNEELVGTYHTEPLPKSTLAGTQGICLSVDDIFPLLATCCCNKLRL